MRKLSVILVCLVLLMLLVGRTGSMQALDATPVAGYRVMLPHIARNPAPTPTPPDSEVLIYDEIGELADATWLYQTFGAVAWQKRDGARLTALRWVTGAVTLVAHVEDESGRPLEHVVVVRYWPGAPPLPAALVWDGTYNRGLFGEANVEGNIGFGMGSGDGYCPSDQVGASAIWVGGPASYLVTGLGWLCFTEHTHLDSDWVVDAAQAQTLQAQSWGFTPGADVRYEDLGYRELVPVVSWPAK